MVLVLAIAACGSGACHAVFVDGRDVWVVGDRLPQRASGRDGDPARTTVRVDLTVFEPATARLRAAFHAAGTDPAEIDELAESVRAGSAYVVGSAATTPPESIGVASHEAAVIARRLPSKVVGQLALAA
ncbi:hypothetical protein [Pseudofrankia inefficax]|uniref:Uncharacterized protein n=1 Tax=Pseudofrankia inefficax (strain DSM 45817 / CECT 9037 / DDB 130130 / EuI1c) TaxID=298654 RepID=E3J7A8_PSEI1|nr:hypothetical protein [Pseudofrankia inefficax]ADP78381.1 hypothetical protein FraEuI1c_0295 [Pseudofrankia inefficax]